MTNSETLSSQDLTGLKPQENLTESSEPEGGSELPEGAKNWQHALQIAREREKQKEQELSELRDALERKKEEEKQKKLAEMGEAEKYKTIAQEETQKRGQLEMRLIVQESLAGKEIPEPVRQLLVKTPWAIPQVADELGDNFTWDEAISAVKRYLPKYVDSLVVKNPTVTPIEVKEEPKEVDSERSVSDTVLRNHVYTRDEIAKLSSDPIEYEKHRARIFKQMQENRGQL